MTPPTPKTVAEWMAAELHSRRELHQEDAAYHIQQHLGDEFVYINDNGNLAIDRTVLAEFRKLTAADTVWVRPERYWRKRESFDDPRKRAAQ